MVTPPRAPRDQGSSSLPWLPLSDKPHTFITFSSSFCQKDGCRLKAQASFIFLIKDV